MTLAERFLQQVKADPEHTALVLQHAGQRDRMLTRAEFLQSSLAYTQAFLEAELPPGGVIILILPHGLSLVSAFWGAILAGCVPAIMPFLTEKLHPERYRQDLQALIEVTQPAAVVSCQEFAEYVRPAANGLPLFWAEETGPRGQRIGGTNERGEGELAELPGLRRSPQDITLLQHSSGTTGLQKGVALAHQAVLNQLAAYRQALQLRSDDVVVSWLPLYHDMGLIAGFILPLLEGLPLVLLSPFDWVRAPHRLLRAVSDYRGTLSWLPNFAYNFCAQKVRGSDLEGVDLSCWRAVINCSEPVRHRSHQIFLERYRPYGLRPEALQTCYAMAENVFAVTQSRLGEPPKVDWIAPEVFQRERRAQPADPQGESLAMVSNGPPLSNVALQILDDEGRPLPERAVGEIALRSDCMLTGYYHRPDATAQAFRDGWYLTGDYGYLADGELYVAGRKKDLIIVGGKNIFPQDLEALAAEVPGVHPGRVAAFGVYNEEAGTEDVVLVAEVDLPISGAAGDNGAAAAAHEQREALAEQIRQHVTRSSAVALRRVVLVPRGWLIKTSSGKVARSANRDKFLAEVGT